MCQGAAYTAPTLCPKIKLVSGSWGTTSFLPSLCSQVAIQRFQVGKALKLAGVGRLKGGPPDGPFSDLDTPDSKQI
jgi:hypothetical protein